VTDFPPSVSSGDCSGFVKGALLFENAEASFVARQRTRGADCNKNVFSDGTTMFAASFLRSKFRSAVKHRALPAIMTNIITHREIIITNQGRKTGKDLTECNILRGCDAIKHYFCTDVTSFFIGDNYVTVTGE
jgi:hypothetical protein